MVDKIIYKSIIGLAYILFLAFKLAEIGVAATCPWWIIMLPLFVPGIFTLTRIVWLLLSKIYYDFL